MKKKLWKAWIVLILAVMTFMVGLFSGCSRDEEWGYFTIEFNNERETARITGLTKLGQQQRFLIMPEEIDGARVSAIGQSPLLEIWPSMGTADISSENLEKVYFISYYYVPGGSFRNSPKLEKAMIITHENIRGNVSPARSYYSNMEYLGFSAHSQEYNGRANVSYFYNYDIEKNYGYYWIDDYDYGSKIEFIPPEPEREGYTFGGWYKEPECINKWDFETDVLPEERTEINEDGEEEVVYQETKLYAKWL